MKRSLNMFSSSARLLAGLFVLAFLFSACKKNDDGIGQQTGPVAGLMALNLSPDQSAVGFSLSGNTLGGGALGYNSYTGGYLPVYTGTREVRTFDYYTGSTLAISNNEFKDSMYYSAFLLGANGNYRNVVVNDQLNSLTVVPGKAWVRYINAIPDSASSPVVTVAGDAPASTPYATVSSFAQVTAGPVTTSISNGTDISANRTVTMEENKAYTLLFIGLPNATDSAKKVQIRVIENGTVTP